MTKNDTPSMVMGLVRIQSVVQKLLAGRDVWLDIGGGSLAVEFCDDPADTESPYVCLTQDGVQGSSTAVLIIDSKSEALELADRLRKFAERMGEWDAKADCWRLPEGWPPAETGKDSGNK